MSDKTEPLLAEYKDPLLNATWLDTIRPKLEQILAKERKKKEKVEKS